ncbi:hypothetical protein M4I33_09345 [Clostridium sp. LY3-2]|uniref:hypothetical protein n=1 Tax=Clostridium sp. LY3-2 TaxID=2942482 RepID=UPI002152F485|nr:hypothetical protein [Clostridium sp. LY3-2]MCR6515071.1 hypothetical protein [Clostridium sp. LY3-2]
MKIGLDTNDDYILKTFKKDLKSKGIFIVDMDLQTRKSIGNEVFEKVIIANTSSLDFYLKVEVRKGNDSIKIYSGEKEESKNFSKFLKDNLKELNVENISLENGENYYLIKNINIPVSIIKVYVSENSRLDKKLLNEKIIESILKI